MRAILYALSLVITGSILCYLAVHAWLATGDFSGSMYETQVPLALAGVVLLTAPFVYQLFQRIRRPNFQLLPAAITPFEQYTLPWPVMLIFGTLITLAVSRLGVLVIWVIGLVSGAFLTTAVPYLNLAFTILAFLWVSSWIGSRCDRRPFLAAMGILGLFTLINSLIQVAAGDPSSPTALILETIALIVFSLISLSRGSKRRLANYFQYLLRLLPQHTHPVFALHAYNEALTLAANAPESEQNRVTPESSIGSKKILE